MFKNLGLIGLILFTFGCNNMVKELNNLEFNEYSVVAEKLPELQERIKVLVKDDYLEIHQILLDSNPTLSPVIDNLLYSFFGNVENGDQVYMLLDSSNDNILLGYYSSRENNVKIYEEKKGVTINGEFDKWLKGE